MTGFKHLQGEFIIVCQGSSSGYEFKQLDLYTYDLGLWAKHGSGYIRIMKDGHTSKANLSWRSSNRSIKSFDNQGRAMA
jgi:hypothetical protein